MGVSGFGGFRVWGFRVLAGGFGFGLRRSLGRGSSGESPGLPASCLLRFRGAELLGGSRGIS